MGPESSKQKIIIRAGSKQLTTIKATAVKLACHENTVRNLIRSGELTPIRITGKSVRLDEAEIDQMIVKKAEEARGDVADTKGNS